MGAMSDHLETVMELVQERRYREALGKLTPWREDAPNQLWAVVEFLAADNPPECPSHYLPGETRNLTATPQDLREMADYLEGEGISGMNVAGFLDLLIWRYAAERSPRG